jgi:hypothetical protein
LAAVVLVWEVVRASPHIGMAVAMLGWSVGLDVERPPFLLSDRDALVDCVIWLGYVIALLTAAVFIWWKPRWYAHLLTACVVAVWLFWTKKMHFLVRCTSDEGWLTSYCGWLLELLEFPLLLTSIWLTARFGSGRRAPWVLSSTLCTGCGYPLVQIDSLRCPECGVARRADIGQKAAQR